MGKQKTLKGGKEQVEDPVYTMDKFIGEGVMFKCKLFGHSKVEGPRGDAICAEAIGKLKLQAKQLNKENKIHKQRIFLNISLKGIRIIDEKTRKLEHAHLVHKVSYISHDKDDRRTFGYIVSLPEGYNLFAFRTEKNAGNVTSSLKELFHAVYLKHKYEREKGKNPPGSETETNASNDAEIERGVEETEEEKDENPYSVPSKFQLFEKRNDEEKNPYAVPNSQPLCDVADQDGSQEETTDDGGNLLDWADVNEELDFIQKDMKRSDTRQLLKELGDFDLEKNPPQEPEQSIFSDDPFFGGASSGMKSSTSDPNLIQENNPFGASNSFAPQSSNPPIQKSRSMEFGLFDNNDAFSSTQQDMKVPSTQPFASEAGDLFSSIQPTQPTLQSSNSDWSTSFGATMGDPAQFSTLSPTGNENSLFSSFEQVPSVELIPEKTSEPNSGKSDPFAALTGDISDIRGTLPTAQGGNVAQFPAKAKPTPTARADSRRVISPGPSILPGQATQQQYSPAGFQQQSYQNGAAAGFSQNNPFNQSTMQYNAGFSPRPNMPPIPSRPDIPAIPSRPDLVSPGVGFQATPQVQQQYVPPMPAPYNQTRQASFQMQGMQNTSPPAPQPAKDPFADLGGSFALGNTPSAQESLYSTVDTSKIKKSAANQASTDMFGMFDNQTSTSGSNGFGSNTASNKTSDQDPFGFGF